MCNKLARSVVFLNSFNLIPGAPQVEVRDSRSRDFDHILVTKIPEFINPGIFGMNKNNFVYTVGKKLVSQAELD